MKAKFGIGVPVGPVETDLTKIDLRKVGQDIHNALNGTGSYGYKQRARKVTCKIEPDHNYSPSEVASALNLSYDAALRLMPKMKGVVDFGTPTRRYKRGKRKLRISGANFLKYMSTKVID